MLSNKNKVNLMNLNENLVDQLEEVEEEEKENLNDEM